MLANRTLRLIYPQPHGCKNIYNSSMTVKTYFKWATYLSLAGVLFAGYLSGIKFFTQTCAFNEPCPYFLGYPACYFGFGMFLAMFITSLVALTRKAGSLQPAKIILIISLLGILFAGYFVSQEMVDVVSRGRFTFYGLGLPTCLYGLIFYILIFALSLKTLRS